MVFVLIDNTFIENDYIYNSGFFSSINIIAININFKIYKNPYYKNSKWFFRDIFKHIKTDIEKLNTLKYKPIIRTNLISDNYYNIKKPRGDVISYEVLPSISEPYNIINKTGRLIYVKVWTTELINKKNPYIKVYKDFLDKSNFIKINTTIIDFLNTGYYNYYTLCPSYNIKLLSNSNIFIDISDIICVNKDLIINILLEEL
mgnify:CR=1 FL=1|tara:strand:+ start:63 stop:668 length:606 start_codon:yes stop_codon:yes gene_type:complete